jgi:hypothetical protein
LLDNEEIYEEAGQVPDQAESREHDTTAVGDVAATERSGRNQSNLHGSTRHLIEKSLKSGITKIGDDYTRELMVELVPKAT